MSSIVGALTGGNGSGMGFQAQNTNILNPATTQQAQDQYTNAQQGLSNQANFLQAVQAQNGLQNQSNVFNQYQNIANGTGPNPAQAMLNQATNANVANQAALMAGQRGSGANAGLIARQAAMQGANTQQQAAGQAATMQANQSLNALGQMGGMATNQANQQANATNAYSQSAQGEQQNILGAIGAQNNANVSMQSNINNANANIAGNVANQQGSMFGGLMQGAGSGLSSLFGGSSPGGADDLTGDAGAGSGGAAELDSAYGGVNAGTDTIQAASPDAISAVSDIFSSLAEGGNVEDTSDGTTSLVQQNGPQSQAAQFLQQQEAGSGLPNNQGSLKPVKPPSQAEQMQNQMAGMTKMGMQAIGKVGNFINTGLGDVADGVGSGVQDVAGGVGDLGADPAIDEGVDDVAMVAAKGGKVPAMVSPGELYLKPKDLEKVKKGANPLAVGEKIPGKPKFPGNDYRNDVVRKDLESGGIVIPNKVMQSKNPQWQAHKFVMAHMKEAALKKGK